MKQIAHIEGMTCEGCVASVEHAIAQLPNVNDVTANLKTGTVEAVSYTHLTLPTKRIV